MRDAFFEELVSQAKLNSNIVILSADHGAFALEEFAKDNGYNGILLRAETQNINQRTQEDLIRLYERSGYSRYYPKIDM